MLFFTPYPVLGCYQMYFFQLGGSEIVSRFDLNIHFPD